MSRSFGVDVTSLEQMASALGGVDVVIDVVNASTTEEQEARRFFAAEARTLGAAAEAANVRQVVTLSIVGIEGSPFGYYRAKLAQEAAVQQAAQRGGVASTILRATQFFELTAQLLALTRDGDRAHVFDVQVQPVAASSVAYALVDAAEQPVQGRARDVAGPERANLVDLARVYAERYLPDLEVVADERSMAARTRKSAAGPRRADSRSGLHRLAG